MVVIVLVQENQTIWKGRGDDQAQECFSQRGESDNCFKIISMKLKHNHNISSKNSKIISQHRKVEAQVKRRLELFDDVGVKTRKSVRALATEVGRVENKLSLPRDYRNYMDRAKRL